MVLPAIVSDPDVVTMANRKDAASEAATVASSSNGSVGSFDPTEAELEEVPKPFFIMDWLDKVDSRALAKAQKMLQTPKTPKKTKSFSKKPPVVNAFLKRSIS